MTKAAQEEQMKQPEDEFRRKAAVDDVKLKTVASPQETLQTEEVEIEDLEEGEIDEETGEQRLKAERRRVESC